MNYVSELIKILVMAVQEFFKNKDIVDTKDGTVTPAPKPEPTPKLPPPPNEIKIKGIFRNRAVLLKAAGEIGIKEVSGSGDNPRIVEYQKYSTVKNLFGWADSVPWCATFACWVLEMVGMTSTNSARARSFEQWGVSVKDNPLPGDIVVFWRDSLASGNGHVTFFLKRSGNMLYCLGGNQSDSVNISAYSADRLRDIRRSSLAGKYTDDQIIELRKIADDIMKGKKVDSTGKVV